MKGGDTSPGGKGVACKCGERLGGRADDPLLADVWHAMLTSIPYISCILV